ncbi:MAG: NAD(P)-dependent oxidoreductase [Hyphomonas sp.]|uniref:NAD(P)-dependent oxidoreductase n=1 Tax=Hyphomonas sp. TaxID=87 RepID=UPI0017BD8726|nr:NAD(P)-dependent oxidoreductase [Hyphomonas sp.]MBU3919140.1 DUF1932 domain-containing protein [Alphaproteobacteria bacterium]MBA3066913.1 NAD(P)-dependent oxidoreductase [Hyphomonas sp.]MBU4060583.1 DUF1932 domain-containing protein [Alphaproteobacteria bacterium]MBU4165851.1 DUF1932 domain-containing protein [Alphaproteobacteria bacterium]MBU4568842.1 DUF1932 domain-containing protein [Alphaproteobacteria bacterium]
MKKKLSFLGFGEAAQTFSVAPGWRGDAAGFDIKTDAPASKVAKLADFNRAGVEARMSCADAVSEAGLVLSLVTADQAVAAAINAASYIRPGSYYLDMNSVAPASKQAASEAITSAGGHYIDVAVMAPVQPAALNVPLLLSGPHAASAEDALRQLGFAQVRLIGERVGDASAIKMIRSVMIKGIEALTAECLLAAEAAGVTAEVLATLGGDWPERANYNLDRMLVHGLRRAAEMDEVCRTLSDLGIDPLLSRGTAARQRALGARGLNPPPPDLASKLAAIANLAEVPPA